MFLSSEISFPGIRGLSGGQEVHKFIPEENMPKGQMVAFSRGHWALICILILWAFWRSLACLLLCSSTLFCAFLYPAAFRATMVGLEVSATNGNYCAKTSLTNFPECFPHLFLSHFKPQNFAQCKALGPKHTCLLRSPGSNNLSEKKKKSVRWTSESY